MPDGKYKTLQGRWFGTKKTQSKKVDDDASEEGSAETTRRYVGRDRLFTLKCKQGKTESVEKYQVLGIFSKFYNKWFIHWEKIRVLFEKGSKKYKVMVRMIQDSGDRDLREVDLEKDGKWGLKFVYCIKYLGDIVSVESDLESNTYW